MEGQHRKDRYGAEPINVRTVPSMKGDPFGLEQGSNVFHETLPRTFFASATMDCAAIDGI